MVSHYSSKTGRLARLKASALWLLGALLLALPLRAEEDYVVDNVTVEAAGADATDAQARAMQQGQTEAFRQLARRLNPAAAAELTEKTPPAHLQPLVKSFEVKSESITPGHYRATLRYHFDAERARALLLPLGALAAPPPGESASSIPPAQAHPRKAVLVLPVFNDGKQLRLWQEDNAWRNVWYDAALEEGGGMVVAPLGDLDDRVDVDDMNVEAATTASLARLYDRYGVGLIDIVTAYYNLKADPKPTLEVTIRQITPEKTETLRRNYVIRSSETPDTLLVRAAEDIATTLYHQQSYDPDRYAYDRLKEVPARADTATIMEWEKLRRKLLAHHTIVGLRFVSLSYGQTNFVILFKGSPEMLGRSLAASGLRVMRDGNELVLGLK